MAKCRYCKETGKISLLTSVVDCDCVKHKCTKVIGCPENFPKDSNLRNGWYSAESAAQGGIVVYLHLTTKEEVEITEISRGISPYCSWTDQKFVGIVDSTHIVRSNKNW